MTLDSSWRTRTTDDHTLLHHMLVSPNPTMPPTCTVWDANGNALFGPAPWPATARYLAGEPQPQLADAAAAACTAAGHATFLPPPPPQIPRYFNPPPLVLGDWSRWCDLLARHAAPTSLTQLGSTP